MARRLLPALLGCDATRCPLLRCSSRAAAAASPSLLLLLRAPSAPFPSLPPLLLRARRRDGQARHVPQRVRDLRLERQLRQPERLPSALLLLRRVLLLLWRRRLVLAAAARLALRHRRRRRRAASTAAAPPAALRGAPFAGRARLLPGRLLLLQRLRAERLGRNCRRLLRPRRSKQRLRCARELRQGQVGRPRHARLARSGGASQAPCAPGSPPRPRP